MAGDLPPGQDEFVRLKGAEELWDGEMESYPLGDGEVLIVRVDGQFHAYDGLCPHQSQPLVEGDLEMDAGILTCWAHLWEFDVRTGAGVNPKDACLTRLDLRIAADGGVEVRPPGWQDQLRNDQPRADQPGADQPGADQPRADQPRADQPRADQPGKQQLGTEQGEQ
jgi:nitrite reductase/ring-hydroxylating ferredoxin subunit